MPRPGDERKQSASVETTRYGHRCPLDKAEGYFVDAIEAWRAQLGLERMALLGHSI